MTQGPNRFRFLSIAAVLAVTLPAAGEWRWSLGLHDMVVPEESSHTRGVSAGIYVRHTTRSGMTFTGAYDLFVDNDEDELDPDHIPVWWMASYQLERELLRISRSTALSWIVDLSGRRNTVSSVEYETRLFPGAKLDYVGSRGQAGASASVGYWMLEIDDDVPAERGYSRASLLNDTLAWSLMARGDVRLGASFVLSGSAQHWGSDDAWLQNRYAAELSHDAYRFVDGGRVVLKAEYTALNLAPYASYSGSPPGSAGYVPILPWNEDLLIRLCFDRSF